MRRKSAKVIRHPETEYLEASRITLQDADLASAVVVRPTWKMRRTHPVPLRIAGADIARAKLIGRAKGLPYQTLLKTYICEGLERDKKLAAR